ncbi:hypothetical protein LJC45_00945 [Alistipes sp. OttesenSCG-928-B03]|nr:hypothetical protein [Alistipes sp. OttesenSCG-928-B03]
MLAHYSGLILLLPLAVLIVGDFRRREVSLVWLIALAVVSVAVSLGRYGIWPTVVNVAANLFLLFYLAIGVIIYIRIKSGRWQNPLREYIGTGDLVFMLAITPLFELRGYVLFLIGASVFSLVWMLAVRAVCGRPKTIPFAATMGIALSIIIIIDTFV